MNILIAHAYAGIGHKKAAEAIYKVLSETKGVDAEIIDASLKGGYEEQLAEFKKGFHTQDKPLMQKAELKIFVQKVLEIFRVDTVLDLEKKILWLNDYFKQQRGKAGKQFYIEIDSLGRRWFFDNESKMMEQLRDEAWSYYPKDYMRLTNPEKDKAKEFIRVNYPQVKDLWRKFFAIQNGLERKFLNYPIQGASASILKVAMGMLWQHTIKHNIHDLELINFVHDEVLARCPEDRAQEYGELVGYYMVEGAKYICSDVAMKADSVLSNTWTH